MTETAAPPGPDHAVDRRDRLVILASSVGTVIVWYDFDLYGSLAAIITAQFFSGVNETTGNIFALMAFAASGSMWMNWRSSVTSAKASMRAWSMVIQRLTPIS